MNSELKIQTPEGIVFAYPLEGPVARCMGATADGIDGRGLARDLRLQL